MRTGNARDCGIVPVNWLLSKYNKSWTGANGTGKSIDSKHTTKQSPYQLRQAGEAIRNGPRERIVRDYHFLRFLHLSKRRQRGRQRIRFQIQILQCRQRVQRWRQRSIEVIQCQIQTLHMRCVHSKSTLHTKPRPLGIARVCGQHPIHRIIPKWAICAQIHICECRPLFRWY